jgi:transposase
VRVYTKAKELGVTSRALLRYLTTYGCELPSASSNLSEEALALIPTQFVTAINWEARFFRRPDDLPARPPWPQLVTGYQASQIAQVSPATIRQWVKRGHLVRADLRGRRRAAVYYVDDVLAARLVTRRARRDKIPVYRVPRLSAETFDALMSARDAAAYLNIPESTIRSWAHRKRIVPAAYEGRSPQYRLSAIYRLIEDRRRPELDLTERPRPARDDWDD